MKISLILRKKKVHNVKKVVGVLRDLFFTASKLKIRLEETIPHNSIPLITCLCFYIYDSEINPVTIFHIFGESI